MELAGLKCFVTGASGFVGNRLVRELVARDARPRCLVRPSSRRDLLDDLRDSIEWWQGDLDDLDSLRSGIDGCEAVFHCAADYRLFVPDPAAMERSNVDGTRNLLLAAIDVGVNRIVYTSTVGALGQLPGDAVSDESVPVTIDDMVGPYKRSKFLAERVADEFVRSGAPIVVVNPSTPVGELDAKPTATGQMVVDFLRGKTPAYVDTGLNLVDVRDVAVGHILALTRGVVGERYILGCSNFTLIEIYRLLEELSGVRAPKIRVPHWVPALYSVFDTAVARLRGVEPRVARDAVRMARKKMFFDPSKAVRELGLPQSPVVEALGRAVTWFRTNGYAP